MFLVLEHIKALCNKNRVHLHLVLERVRKESRQGRPSALVLVATKSHAQSPKYLATLSQVEMKNTSTFE